MGIRWSYGLGCTGTSIWSKYPHLVRIQYGYTYSTGTNVSHTYQRVKMAISNLCRYGYGSGTLQIWFGIRLGTREGKNRRKTKTKHKKKLSMFGSSTQIQFSVFEFRKWWARSLVLLFGNCFLCLNSNTNTVLTLLKSTKMKTSFGCFHLLNSVLNNIKIFSLSLQHKIPLFNGHIFSLSLSHDARSLGYGEWRSSNSRQSRDNQHHRHRHCLSK